MNNDSLPGWKRFIATRAGKWTLGAAIIFVLALIGGLSEKKDNSNANQVNTAVTAITNTSTNTATTNTNTAPVVKTPEQILGERLASTVKNTGTTDVTYGDYKIEKSDSDRPVDTQMVTINVNVSSFYNKSALLKDTGKLTSSLFEVVYGIPGIRAYDVFVNYNGEVTDKYGNKKMDTLIVYDTDKPTYQKINWQNFDQASLCDFLANESKGTGTFNTACNVLVNIQ